MNEHDVVFVGGGGGGGGGGARGGGATRSRRTPWDLPPPPPPPFRPASVGENQAFLYSFSNSVTSSRAGAAIQ
jgi:hypothetical protein